MGAESLRRKLGRQKGECTWCGQPVPRGRQTWCGQQCVDAYRTEHDWGWVRSRVFDRDRGVCRLCGADTMRIHRLVVLAQMESWDLYLYVCAFYSGLGFGKFLMMDQWQADHIVPRVRGGSNDLSNLRTLCVPCHKGVTAELARERAAERRAAKRAAQGRLF